MERRESFSAGAERHGTVVMDGFDFDYLVVGAGFGGSVAALRLAERGYSVAIVERGRRWPSGDLPATNWNVPKFLWAPWARCFGIQAITMLRDVMVLHGCGVGGGSLVYGGVLLEPPEEVFANPPWSVLGTVPLLMKCKRNRSLPAISDRLGDLVRTNSEALVGSISRHRDVDYSQGIAIASGSSPDEDTNIELVRYGSGHDFMSLLCTLQVGGGPPWPRPLRFLAEALRRPGRFLRTRNPLGWARRTGILLVMQSVPNHMRLKLRRRWFWPFSQRLDSDWHSPQKVPKYLPVANDVARRLADRMHGDPASSFPEVLFGLTSTAHILGGCTMGRDPSEGVVDKYGRLFHYDNFYVADGSVVSANLRVNPSLTITALSEWIMSHVPAKSSRGDP